MEPLGSPKSTYSWPFSKLFYAALATDDSSTVINNVITDFISYKSFT